MAFLLKRIIWCRCSFYRNLCSLDLKWLFRLWSRYQSSLYNNRCAYIQFGNLSKIVHCIMVNDLKGLKIRAQNNSVQVKGLSAFGCSISTMSFSEVFTSLQQGTIDGQENPIETLYNFQYYDVQDYVTISNHLCTAGAVVCNNAWYEGLSDEFKAAVDKAAQVAEAYSIEELNSSESEVLSLLAEKMQVTELTEEQLAAFQDVAKTAWPELVDEIGSDYMNEFLTAAGISMN